MDKDTADRLEEIIASLSQHIEVLRACGLSEARRLLCIAKLDLQMRIHEISDAELRALCDALERKDRPTDPGEVINFGPAKGRKRETTG